MDAHVQMRAPAPAHPGPLFPGQGPASSRSVTSLRTVTPALTRQPGLRSSLGGGIPAAPLCAPITVELRNDSPETLGLEIAPVHELDDGLRVGSVSGVLDRIY